MKFNDVVGAIPSILAALPKASLQILIVASTEARRKELNEMFDLGGEKRDTYQYSLDHDTSVVTVLHPVQFEPTRYRGRTYLMVVLDSAIAEDFRTNSEFSEMRATLNIGMQTVCSILGTQPADLYFDVMCAPE